MQASGENKDKQVKISADRHRLLKILAAKTGKEMKEIIHEAFDMYYEKLKEKE
jgi:hypothetical protein